jgi:transmembrane sensor
MNELNIYELMVKHLQQSISDTEQAELDKALIADSNLKVEFDKLSAAWQATENYGGHITPNVNAAWNKVQQKIKKPGAPKVIPLYKRTWASAAALALLLGIGFVIYQQLAPPVWKDVLTKSEAKEILLPDGSKIWLNHNSTLSYPEKFARHRQINLSGEAFFEVAKDAAHPFTITAHGTTTQVLGTSFNVRAYNADREIEVSVATGKVWFSAQQDSEKLVLLPGDRGRYDIAEHGVEKLKTEDNYLAWKTGELVFNHSMAPQVLNDLQRYYSIQLNIKDTSVTSLSFSGRLNRQPLNSALEILKSSLGLRIIRDSAQSYSVYSK